MPSLLIESTDSMIKHSCKVPERRGYIIIPSPSIAFRVQRVVTNSRPHQCRIVFHEVVRSSKGTY